MADEGCQVIAAVYARLSKEDTRTAGDNGTARQLELGRGFVVKNGWTVNESYVLADAGVSGANFDHRPGLVRLLEGARQKPRPFDIVVVAAIDRIGREQVATSGVLKRLTRAGIQVWCYQDGQRVLFNTPTQKFMVGVGGFAAEEYRDAVRGKTIATLRKKATEGHATGPTAFGYRNEKQGGHTVRVICEEQAVVVRRAFQLAADGHGDDRVRNLLTTEHPRASGWTKNAVRRMLSNEVYIGTSVYGKIRNVDDDGRGTREPVPESEWIRVAAPELRIISDELWQQVQDRKAKTRAHYVRTPGDKLAGKPESGVVARYMLSGIARCGVCGGTMTMLGGYHRKRYYCLQRAHRGAAYCSNKGGVPMDVLDQAVLAVLYDELLSDPARLWKMIQAHDAQRQLEREAHQGTRVNVEKEVARLETQIGRLVAALAAGTASADITTAITDRRAQVAALQVAPALTPVTKARYLTGYAAFRVMLNSRHPLAVRQVLRKLGCDRITITRTGEHTWDFAGEFDAGCLIEKGPAESAGGM